MIVFLKLHQVFKWIVETATGSWVVFLVQEGIKWLSEMESDLDVMGSGLANMSLLRQTEKSSSTKCHPLHILVVTELSDSSTFPVLFSLLVFTAPSILVHWQIINKHYLNT